MSRRKAANNEEDFRGGDSAGFGQRDPFDFAIEEYQAAS